VEERRLEWSPEQYERFRPSPPDALLDALAQWAGGTVERVADLGSGTGLSTRAWAGRAREIVGVEPTDRMRAHARSLGGDGVRYVDGTAEATGLPDGWADVVTCSQSLHWMEPEPTFAEAARILGPDGVFAAYDYDPLPLVHPEVDAAYRDALDRLDRTRPRAARLRAPKAEHAERMRASGRFRLVREAVFHSALEVDADRLVGLLATFGHYSLLAEGGAGEEELGLAPLRRAAERVLGDGPARAWIGYRVRVGIV
jgi:SAM-dependent methyltransferase